MKPEKKLLIHELLGGEDGEVRRQSTLTAGARLLRRRRWQRRALPSLATLALIAVAGYPVHQLIAPRPRAAVQVASQPSSAIHFLTDDELLALSPNTPVALATVGDRKILIFPRAGDEEKFVGHF